MAHEHYLPTNMSGGKQKHIMGGIYLPLGQWSGEISSFLQLWRTWVRHLCEHGINPRLQNILLRVFFILILFVCCRNQVAATISTVMGAMAFFYCAEKLQWHVSV